MKRIRSLGEPDDLVTARVREPTVQKLHRAAAEVELGPVAVVGLVRLDELDALERLATCGPNVLNISTYAAPLSMQLVELDAVVDDVRLVAEDLQAESVLGMEVGRS